MKILLDIDEFKKFDNLIESEKFFDDILIEEDINEGSQSSKIAKAKKADLIFKKRLEKIKVRRNKLAYEVKNRFLQKINALKKLGKNKQANDLTTDMNDKLDKIHDSADTAAAATKKKREEVRQKYNAKNNKELQRRNKLWT